MPGKGLLKRAAAGIAALVIAISSAGCGGQTASVTSSPPVQTSAPDTPVNSQAVPDTRESLSVPPEQTAEETAGEITADTTADTTPQPTEETTPADNPQTLEETAPAPEAEETAEPPAETTTTAHSTEPPAPQTAPQTTSVTTEKPKPVQVVIPEVKQLSSPGSLTAAADTGVIDYSNASLGYISVCYTGASDKVKLRLINGEQSNDHNVTPGGGAQYIPLSLGSGKYKMELYERVEGKMYALVLETEIEVKIADEVGMYLYPNRYCMFTGNSACVKKAAELCAGAEGTVEKLAAIFGWVTDNVSYDYDLASTVTSGYVPDPDATLAKCTGICFDYASLTAAMARSQGIPTRLVIGYAGDIYHAWNEVWTEETGWITPELLLSQKGYNRIDATFYSSNPNKELISRFISDNGKYSAVCYY